LIVVFVLIGYKGNQIARKKSGQSEKLWNPLQVSYNKVNQLEKLHKSQRDDDEADKPDKCPLKGGRFTKHNYS
jgi:hypothetical protein